MTDLFSSTSFVEAKKSRTITITKTEVYNEIQSITYKFMQTSLDQSGIKVQDAASSDMDGKVDELIIKRGVEYYEAHLRGRIRFRLADEEMTAANDNIQAQTQFIFSLSVPESFKDSVLKSVAVKIHNFLVWGGLYRWYLEHGLTSQAMAYKSELEDMEDDIVGDLRAPNKARRPLQPFGPAQTMSS